MIFGDSSSIYSILEIKPRFKFRDVFTCKMQMRAERRDSRAAVPGLGSYAVCARFMTFRY